MTCIVGIVKDSVVHIGGDSAGVAGYQILIRDDKKVFKNGPYVFGFTSSFRMGQILQYASDIPEPLNWDVNRFMSTTFMDFVRKIGTEAGYLGRDHEGRETFGSFIVGYKEHMFTIYDDLQVAVVRDGIAAVGCGAEIALGAAKALMLSRPDLEPAQIIESSLEISAYYNAGVRAPFHILSTTTKSDI